MSGQGVIDLPVTGQVDAALIRGLIDLGEALKAASQKTEESGKKAERASVSWASMREGIGKAADTFNEVHAAITTNLAMINDLVESVTRLATEQAHLDSASTRLGLDFDEAAAAAGRFADETDALAVANQFHARDITLTQTQINALFRVAGAHAEELGVSVGQAADQLTQALIRGREAGLDRFGQALGDVSGTSHGLGERLDALVRQAGEVAQGTDDAATRMDRLHDSMDDAKRVAASAFVDTITRIESLSRNTRTAATDTDDLNTKMEALGRTAARTLELVGRPVAMLLGGVAIGIQSIAAAGSIRAALESGGIEAARAESQRQAESLRALGEFTRGQYAGFQNALGDTNERTTDGNGPSTDPTHRPAPSADAARTAAALRSPNRGRHGESIASNDNADDLSDYARQTEQEKLKSEERRAAAAHGQREARKEELAKLAEIHDAEQRVRQETELRLAGARELATQREREARDFDRWLASQTERLAAEQDREKAQERTKRDRERDEAKQRDTGNQLRDYFTRQMRDANTMADVVEGAYSRMTSAASAHFGALVTGKETAAQALQGFVHDTLAAFAELAAQQALYELAKGLAALFLNPAEAAAHFGAAALFGGIAAGAGALSQAVPATQPAGNASPAGGGAGPNRTSADRRSTSNDNAAPIIVQYYAPVIGGRDATDAELGVRLGRYDDAARARRTRRAA